MRRKESTTTSISRPRARLQLLHRQAKTATTTGATAVGSLTKILKLSLSIQWAAAVDVNLLTPSPMTRCSIRPTQQVGRDMIKFERLWSERSLETLHLNSQSRCFETSAGAEPTRDGFTGYTSYSSSALGEARSPSSGKGPLC
jgi:hypothetical protein